MENTKLIQVGITLADNNGRTAGTWQFNLHYDLEYSALILTPTRSEQHCSASIELLKEAGVDFAQHKLHGIDQDIFAEYLTTSGTREEMKTSRFGLEQRDNVGVLPWDF